MKIGDEVFVHSYIDEIRNDTIIIHNKGGYFGTVKDEVITGQLPKKGKAKAEDEEEGKAEADAPKGFYKKMTFFFTEGQTELRKEGN